MSKAAEEIHAMSDEELTIEVNRLRRHHYDLKSQMVTEKVEDPSQLHKTRKDIARLLTEQRVREIEANKAKA